VSLPATGEQFELRHDDQRAVVVEVGGALREYTVGEHDVLDGFALDERSDGGRGQPLMPWPNRLCDGRYAWDGQTLQLALNDTKFGHAIHGLVRWRNWQVLAWEPSRITFGLRLFPMTGYPFTLGLTIDYELSDAGLRVCARAENLGTAACPYGVGFHPYVTVGGAIDAAQLTLPAARMLIPDERLIPVSSQPVAGTPYDFRAPREIGSLVLDACFHQFARDDDGRARVTLTGAESDVTVWLGDAYHYVMLYTGDTLAPERRRRALAVEPMSCPPNAFASADGVIRLEPMQTHTAEWGIKSRSGLGTPAA
jgi:aldose 1-epimerase